MPFFDCPDDPCPAETMMNILGMPDRIKIPDIEEFCKTDPEFKKNPDEEKIDL